METKRERFIRVAENRTNKIINMIRLLGNCSNKGNYEYSDEDVKQIFAAIESELKNAKSKYYEVEQSNKKFSLK